jgi:hypothetical protein
MHIPSDFAEKLERDFGGRLRVRWSHQRGEYVIEEKVGRAALPAFRTSEIDDHMIRERDGYAFVLAVRPGDRMACPHCHLTMKVPVREFREVICTHCQWKGRDGRYQACYWPLGDSLLEYLRKIDPLRDGPRRMADEAAAHNEQRDRIRDKDYAAGMHDVLMDAALSQIPKTGYRGATPYWNDAP